MQSQGTKSSTSRLINRLTEVDTLGLASCAVSDRGIWSVATHRGIKIERLSLNNCLNLTNASIPSILPFTPNLQVLELRGCVKITYVRPIVEFRRKGRERGVLVEGCEVLEERMIYCEEGLEKEKRQKELEYTKEQWNTDVGNPWETMKA
jgi:antagonist of mitotic exit network protein 1